MKIIQKNFFTLLSGIKQYQIPIYQRNYAWSKDDCKRLMEDIITCGQPGKPNHYIGSVIVKKETRVGGVNILSVIDGQQRTTTISLLLLAICDYFAGHSRFKLSSETIAFLIKIKNKYIINSKFNGSSFFSKLYLKSGEDRTEYDNLIHGVKGTGLISRNYNFFFNELADQSIDPKFIFDGISNAKLALVTLAPGENPQLLFEAVNDTGVDLTEVDKVRNWIFMGLPIIDQDKPYRKYWQPIENGLGSHINAFLRYYVILKTSRIVGNEYYKDFKSILFLKVRSQKLVENLLTDIQVYEIIYTKILNKGFADKNINEQLFYINETNKENFTPVMLKILRNYDKGVVNLADTIAMLKLIESYIVRRDILNIPTNLLNAAMINMLNGCDSLPDFENKINNLTHKQRMPSDDEMYTQLHTEDFYGLSNAYYYLERIEKSVNPSFSLKDPTIEHILPETMHTNADPKPGVKNPNDYNWELDLGPDAKKIHDTYQHTLGNLTILPRSENTRMGDYRFDFKKNWSSKGADGFNYGYAFTCIRISQSLKCFVNWNEKSILKRSDEMTKYICGIWPHP